jgi:hypothetical protein
VVPKRNIIKNRRTTKNSKIIEHLINSNVRSDPIVNMTAVVLFYRIGSLILSIRTLNDYDDDDYENKSSSLLINTLLYTTHTSFNLLIILISTTTNDDDDKNNNNNK